jgi:hypothetical protein
LEQAFFNRLKDLPMLALRRLLCPVISVSGIEFLSLLDLLDNFF